MKKEALEKLVMNCETRIELEKELGLENICIVVLDEDKNIKELIKDDIYANDEIANYDNCHYISDIISSLIDNKNYTHCFLYHFEIDTLLKTKHFLAKQYN